MVSGGQQQYLVEIFAASRYSFRMCGCDGCFLRVLLTTRPRCVIDAYGFQFLTLHYITTTVFTLVEEEAWSVREMQKYVDSEPKTGSCYEECLSFSAEGVLFRRGQHARQNGRFEENLTRTTPRYYTTSLNQTTKHICLFVITL